MKCKVSNNKAYKNITYTSDIKQYTCKQSVMHELVLVLYYIVEDYNYKMHSQCLKPLSYKDSFTVTFLLRSRG